MERYTFAILVRNQSGVLNRVTSLFRRRQFNISSLTVSETESRDLSRITVLFDGDELTKRQLMNQLMKLPDIQAVHELDKETTINCELLLVKMANSSASDRNDILDAAGAFGAKIMDYTRDAIILRLVGSSRRVDDFIDLMRDYQILEICRTGIVSLERGSHTMRSRTKL